MAYSPPVIDPTTGLVIPSFSDIQGYLIAQFLAIYGAACNLDSSTADGQDTGVRSLQLTDFVSAMQQVYLSLNPLTATGPALDLCGQMIANTTRKPGTFSFADLALTGVSGTTIPSGIVQDTVGRFWAFPGPVVIGAASTFRAYAQTVGNIAANAGTINVIATPTAGWTGVTNPSAAVPGVAVEPDSVYRARLIVAQAKPSLTTLAGTAAAVAAVLGVTRSQVYDNPTGSTDVNGIPAHSLCCVVGGGASTDIAQAIYSNRGIGGGTFGSTSVVVVDPNNGGLSLTISFDVLVHLPVFVGLSVHPLTGFTSATEAAIQQGIVNYLNSLGIGQPVVYGELYAAALTARPDPDHPLFAITSLTSGYAAASTTGTVTAFSPTVTVASATGIAPGQAVVGAGILPGTTVLTVVSTTVTLSANASAGGTLVPLDFFTTVSAGTSITVAFNAAAQGATGNVVIALV